jgi:hypothetical protein
MFFRKAKRQEPKRKVSASVINDIAAMAEWSTRLRAAAPLSIKQTPAGPVLGMTSYLTQLAVANGNISARSGTAAGVGSVFLVSVQATFSAGAMVTATLTTSTIPIPVLNPSAATMTSGNGIDSGMYCAIYQDLSSFYFVVPLECS